jgi:DNA-binding IclR family transcriptional regulator
VVGRGRCMTQAKISLADNNPAQPVVEGAISVRSVERAFDLLLALELSGQSLRLSDLARSTGIHKATAQRLLFVLERRGLAQRVHGRYQVGAAAMPLAQRVEGENPLRYTMPIGERLPLHVGARPGPRRRDERRRPPATD